MSERENQRLVEEQVAILNSHNVERYVKTFAESFVWESDVFPNPVRGPEGVKQIVSTYFQGFPDLHMEIEQIVASGDQVVTRWHATGTHKGEFNGIAPTNRRISVHGCTVGEVKKGLTVRAASYWDQFTMMRQLGVPAAKGASAG
jgi:steroid delta-isomerase-like uncharacterized protein